MKQEFEMEAKIFKAFCDENRLQILAQLRSGEKCACKLLEALQISQPTLSHHARILCESGVVRGRKEGKWVHYSIDPEGARRAVMLLAGQLKMDEEPGLTCDCNCDGEEQV